MRDSLIDNAWRILLYFIHRIEHDAHRCGYNPGMRRRVAMAGAAMRADDGSDVGG